MRIIQPGRTFLSRMYATAAKLLKLHFYTRSIRSSDQTYAGETFSSTAGMEVCSNAQLHRKWLQLEWSHQWSTVHIMFKELLPIVLSCAVKGPLLARHKVPFQCDNSGVVAALQKDSARDNTIVHLLRCLWFFVAHYQGHSRQSGWSGFGRTTISQHKIKFHFIESK